MLQTTCDVKTTWVQGHPDLCRHMVSLANYELTYNFKKLSVIINNRANIFALITYQSTYSYESRSRDMGFHTKLDVSWDFSAAISHRIMASAIGLPRLVKTVTWHKFSKCPLICDLTQRLGGTVYILGNVCIILYAWRCIVQCLSIGTDSWKI